MNVNEIIKYPILTEKTHAQMSSGIYTFAVDKRTNKIEIKNAVEFIFDVKVARVNVINVDRKPTKLGRFAGFKSSYKKAIVKLANGQINLFPEDVEPETPVKKTKAETKQKEMSEAESKAAAKIAAKLAAKEAKVSKNEKEEKPAAKKEEKPAAKK